MVEGGHNSATFLLLSISSLAKKVTRDEKDMGRLALRAVVVVVGLAVEPVVSIGFLLSLVVAFVLNEVEFVTIFITDLSVVGGPCGAVFGTVVIQCGSEWPVVAVVDSTSLEGLGT